MKTKRRRLAVDEPVVITTKRKVISMGSEEAVIERKIKTKKVRKPEPVPEPVPEPTKKKRRKPVRRKKQKQAKKIDEKAMQSDLLSGFIGEEE